MPADSTLRRKPAFLSAVLQFRDWLSRHSSAAANPPAPTRLTLHRLEGREVPASVPFLGTADDDLLNPLNYANGTLPTTADHLTVGTALAGRTPFLNGDLAVRGITAAVTLRVAGGTLSFGREASALGGLSVAAGGTVQVQTPTDAFAAGGVRVNGGVRNDGTFRLLGTAVRGASVTLTAGTFENAGTLDLRAEAGRPGTLAAGVVNTGAVLASGPVSVGGSGTVFRSAGGGLTVAAGGTLSVLGGSVWDGTTLSGGGTVDLAGTFASAHTATLQSDLTVSSGGPVVVLSGAATVDGPGRLVNEGTLELNGDTVRARLVNTGRLTVTGGSTVGVVENAAGGVLTVGGVSPVTLTATADLTNRGVVDVRSGGGFGGTGVTLSGGVLVNTTEGEVRLGGAGGSAVVRGAVTNAGRVTVKRVGDTRADPDRPVPQTPGGWR